MDRTTRRSEQLRPNRRKTEHILWVVGILAAVGITWWLIAAQSPMLPPLIHAGLLGLCLFFLPGYLVRCGFLADSSWPFLSQLPVYFSLSLGVGALVWLAARALGGALGLFGYLMGGAVAILAVSVILSRLIKAHGPWRGWRGKTGWELVPFALVLAAIVFWTVIVYRIGASYMPGTDNWYFLAVVRRIGLVGNLAPGDPFFAGVADPERSGPWLAMVAFWARQSGVELVALWDVLPALVMPISLLAFFWLAWTLFQDRWVAALSVVLILAGRAGYTWNEPMMMAAPSNVALLLSFVALALGIQYSRSGRTAWLVTALLLAGTTAVQHILVFAGLLLTLLGFGVAQLGMGLLTSRLSTEQENAIRPTHWTQAGRRLVLVAVVGVFLAIPAFLFWAGSMAGTANLIYQDLWGLFKTLGPWHVLRVSSLSGGGHLFAFSFLLLPLLLLFVRQHDWAVYLLSMMVLVVLVAFTPPMVELILQAGLVPPWAIWRLAAQVYPFQFTVAALFCWGARQVWPSSLTLFGGRRWLSAIVLCGLMILGLVPNATPMAGPLLEYVQKARQGRPMEDAVNWLREGPLAALPPAQEPVVVLSDVDTSYLVSGLTGHHVVAISYGRSSPLVVDDQERRERVSRVLTTEADVSDMRAIMQRYGATMVMLVEGQDLGADVLSPNAWEYWVDTLDAANAEFKCLFYDGTGEHRAAVYAWQTGTGIP